MSRTFPEMIFFRVLQGMGGGSLIPLAQAILRETFPKKEQGMAMAMFGMGVVLAPAFGPVVGGWITDNYGWPWIFYINVPISLVGITLVSLFVHDPPYLKRGVKKIDGVGIALLTLGLTGLQTILERGQQENWFDSRLIVWGTVFTVAVLVSLIFWEMRVAEPVVDLHVFRNPQFRIGVTVILLYGVALYGTTFILPQFTQRLLNYSAFQAGLVLMPRAMVLVVFLPLVGKLYNHVDPRGLMLFGIVVVCTSYYLLAHLATTAARENIVPILILMGAGMPFIFVPLTTVSLSTIAKKNMTSASGLYTLCQQMGGNIGYALMATLLERFAQAHHVYFAEHINAGNYSFENLYRQATGLLHQQGLAWGQAREAAIMLVNRIVTQQSEMMAYNDISIVLMFLFVATALVVLFIPVEKGHAEIHAVTE
jgi:DHA2 family multidrug resistance protein